MSFNLLIRDLLLFVVFVTLDAGRSAADDDLSEIKQSNTSGMD